MRSETLQLIIRAKETASKEFKKLDKALGVTRKRIISLRKTALNLKTAFAGLAIGYTAKNFISAANEQAKAVAGMETALRSMGEYTPELSARMQDIATNIQSLTNFGDEAILMGQKFLITYKDIGIDMLPRTSMAMADLAALMGGDMKSAANMLGKASMGMIGELRRVGITVDASVYKTEGYIGVLREIEKQSKGQAIAQRKATGSMIAMGNAFGDLKEKVGEYLKLKLESTFQALLDSFTALNKIIVESNKSTVDLIKSGEKADTLADTMIGAMKRISLAITLAGDAFRGWKMIFAGIDMAFALMIGGMNKGILQVKIKLKLLYEHFSGINTILHQITGIGKEVEETGDDQNKTLKENIKYWDKVLDKARKRLELLAREELYYTRIDKLWEKIEKRVKKRKEEPLPQGEKPSTSPAPSIPIATDEAKAKSHLARLIASTKTALLILANTYKDGEVTLQQYFDRRRELIEKQYAEELAIMNAAAKAEADPSKRLAIQDKIFAKEQDHKRTLINLTNQQIEAEKALAQAKIEIDQAMADLRLRAESEKGGGLLQAGFDEELAEMDARHAEELQSFKDLLNDKLAAEMGYADEAAAMRDVQGMQRLEKEKLLADQERRIRMSQLENARTIAGGMADIFDNLYELSGKKQKEFFYLAKAAALAEAIMNTANAITGALGSPPYSAGAIAMAAVVGAMGAIQIATITAQSLAAGGKIQGSSMSTTADNIPIMATAGEYMQPVKTVQYYGHQVMEAMRQRLIPREIFAGLALPDFTIPRPAYAFASGGPVSAQAAGGEDIQPGITIINVTDPRELDQYLASSAGQNAVLNVLSSRAEAVRRVLR